MPAQAWSQDKVLTMPVPGNAALDNLDPRVLLTTNHQAVQIAIFDSLVRSKGTDIVPAAAEKWEISPDGKTYTFHLRATKWSDGKPVTGQDFVDAFVRMFTTSRRQLDLRRDPEWRRGARQEGRSIDARREGAGRQDRGLYPDQSDAVFPGPADLVLFGAQPGRPDRQGRRRLRRIGRQHGL